MGCGSSTKTNDLRDAEKELSDLRRRIDDNEREKSELLLQLEAAQNRKGFQKPADPNCDVTGAPPAPLTQHTSNSNAATEPDVSPLASAAEDRASGAQARSVQEHSRTTSADCKGDPAAPLLEEAIMVVPPARPKADVERPAGQPVMLLPGVANAEEPDEATHTAEVTPANVAEAPSLGGPAATTDQAAPVIGVALPSAEGIEGGNAGKGGGDALISGAATPPAEAAEAPVSGGNVGGEVDAGNSDEESIAPVAEGIGQSQADADMLEKSPRNIAELGIGRSQANADMLEKSSRNIADLGIGQSQADADMLEKSSRNIEDMLSIAKEAEVGNAERGRDGAGLSQSETKTEQVEPYVKNLRNMDVENANAEEVVPKDKDPLGKFSPRADLCSCGGKLSAQANFCSNCGMKRVEARDLAISIDSEASTRTPATPVAPSSSCHQCAAEGCDLFVDQTDQQRYCARCWIDYYGQPPPLVSVEVMEIWPGGSLAQAWALSPILGWPPVQMPVARNPLAELDGEVWSDVAVRVRRDMVGSHAREQNNLTRPFPNEVLRERYRCRRCVGEGHFTKAFLAEDLTEGGSVCVKRHRTLTVEGLADLMVLCKRLQEVDEGAVLFPRLIDTFYDIVGFTVESLLEGSNCLAMTHSRPDFFTDVANLRHVAWGGLQGLAMLEKAGVVHNDIKPDNLMWVEVSGPETEGSTPQKKPQVRIVDFGCARLDHREEPGRNWSLAEGGAGHLGKWSPEMCLRLPISHKSDVWGLAVSLCELHCGRTVWRNEADTAEVVFAQAIGLCNLREGIPTSMLKRSPLDIRQLYTPQPKHFPVRRSSSGQFEALHPARWGIEQVLGKNWQEIETAELGGLLQAALIVDPVCRPSAADLLKSSSFVAPLRDGDDRPACPEDAQPTTDHKSEKSLTNIEKAFKEMDRNNDGAVDPDEFKAWLSTRPSRVQEKAEAPPQEIADPAVDLV